MMESARWKRSGGSGIRSPRCAPLVRSRRLLERGRPDPARLGDVDRDPVGGVVLHLDVRVAVAGVADPEGLVDVVAWRRPGALQPLGDRLQALDLETDVVDAAPAGAALDPGDRVILEVEDREVDVAVAQVVTPGARAVDLRDLLHAEHVDVELRSRVHVLGREGDVLDLRHGVSPVAMVRVRPLGLSGHTTPEGAETPGHSRPFVTAETGPCARSRRGIAGRR